MRKFLLLGLGAFAFFSSACNDDVSLATSDVVVDSSSSVAPVPVEESSSSESSNSDAPNPVTESSSAESSSSKGDVSSSSVKSSSSGKRVNSSFYWDGTTDYEGRVETGSPEETSGYWFNYSDDYEGGSSRFTFPSDVEPDIYDNFFGPLVEAYGGIKASVTLDEGYDYPYVGLGFNVWSENQEGVDVSEWGGLCISYQSTIPFFIELGVEDEAILTEYVKYRASVSASNLITYVDFSWAKFKSSEFVGSVTEDVLKKVAAIKLRFEGEAGTTGDFLIQKIGSLGECRPGLCKRQ
ncbi:hypothetical protein [Fibrobacter sp.]|uniref:hypothetical protein n=1 Tax=Fibrobacter sp. TaxID=35828 RepID=UPI0025BAEBB6|nr:hypothetical protein [Fibrobacter sp.]MBR2057783.1 hypothetical protein [Fibrobacter sp.]MBR2308619.1 hypothetical protein [Fibrobacter sp.]MBR4008103.1 hypothetical protein [Fibrobacter sp.]